MLFPKTVFVENTTIDDQMLKIATELMEATVALDDPAENYESVAIELWDVIQAVETALRILEKQYGVNVNIVRQYVYEKNRSRKYYKEG